MEKIKGWLPNLFSEKFVIVLIILGFLSILISFLTFGWNDISWDISSQVNSEKIGHLGDFIGGISGSLWALASVILFYIALIEQRKELRQQKDEFIANRALSIVYKQIDRLDSVVQRFNFKEDARAYLGIEGLYFLADKIQNNNWNNVDLEQLSNLLIHNHSYLKSLFNIIHQSQIVIEKTSGGTQLKNEMKDYMFSNLDASILTIAERFTCFVKMYNKMIENISNNTHKKNHLDKKNQIEVIFSIIKKIDFPNPTIS